MSSTARQRPSSSTAGPSRGPKLLLAPPASFSEIVLAIILHVCRKYLFYDINYKIGIYCIFVSALSFFGDLAPLPRHFYLVNKRNFLNDYFVKWGLLWTLALLSPFVYYTSKVYSADSVRNIRQQMARLIIAVVMWFICTKAFAHVEKVTGFCTKSAYPDRTACAIGSGRWLSFDVSGHCFLLIYCSLMIEEETRVYRSWERIRGLLNQSPDPPEVLLLNDSEKSTILQQHGAYSLWIRLLFIALTVLHLLWDFMLAITSLYYHNWPQKIAGVASATAAWYVTYGLWYRTAYSPGLPGHCKMRYQQRQK